MFENPLAILTATQMPGMAVLTSELNTADNDGWVQLLPDGEFSAIDGRPHDVPNKKWKLTPERAQQLISQAQLRANDLVIDYEHQTLQADKNGNPAPASGFFKDMEYRPGKGLYIKPKWTERAQAFLKNGEYRYISAVFPYDKQTGEPTEIRMAALTNYPGLDGMDAIAALAAEKFTQHPSNTGAPEMNQHLKNLLAKLGIEVGDEMTDEQGLAALTALAGLQAKAKQADELTDQVAALKASPGNVDLAQYVPIATYNAVVGELAVLRQDSNTQSIESLIADAQAEGKIVAAETDYLTKLGKENGVAVLKGVLDARPAIAALKGKQTTQTKPPQDDNAKGNLTAEDLAVLKATGLSEDEFLAARKAQA
ncbi:I protein [Catenovulum agarivorans DS-2]|uniref:I protein n=1 Tax=Catenovulum agarivorans DS-2 TaxID=1328313 RepID=W7QD63_9ALTE|nr:phage protease [Catenovulum agarivorans]EWH09856.1 I protein [Catenovulum agarivorans DS-2]